MITLCKYCGCILTDTNAKTYKNGKDGYRKRAGWCLACDNPENRPDSDDYYLPIVNGTPCCDCAEDLDRLAERVVALQCELNRIRARLVELESQ